MVQIKIRLFKPLSSHSLHFGGKRMKKYILATALALVLGTAAFSSAQAIILQNKTAVTAAPSADQQARRARVFSAIDQQQARVTNELRTSRNPDDQIVLKRERTILARLRADPNYRFTTKDIADLTPQQRINWGKKWDAFWNGLSGLFDNVL
jgi:hypothetical protein